MTEPNVTPNISDCQFQKSFIQAGLFPGDGNIVLLTKKENNIAYMKAYYKENASEIKTRSKNDYSTNKDERIKQRKIYHDVNKDKISKQRKIHYKENAAKINEKNKVYRDCNKNKINNRSKTYSKSSARYNTYKDMLQMYEKISQDENGILLVSCAYCDRFFNPTNRQIRHRINSINGTSYGELRLYCSEGCKIACPIYHQKTRYKFQQIGNTREVPAEFRQMALKDRNYICETCGSDENGLHVHHIEGYTEMPMMMADLPNVKVLCAACHRSAHSVPGCFYVDYSCNNQNG